MKKPEIGILRGYPASGKTSAAKRAEGLSSWVARVSRDDIRKHRFGLKTKGTLSQKEEQEVTKIQEALVRAHIAAGKSVIVDDTNLKARYARRWVDLAEELEVDWLVEDFLTPVEECIERNYLRDRSEQVPEDVIRDYAKRFPIGHWPEIKPSGPKEALTFPKYEANLLNPPAYIFDIDGTLADLSHRSPYDSSQYHNDSLFLNIADLAVELSENYHIIFLSGRSEDHRKVTEEWLNFHLGFHLPLFMRPSGDSRNDAIVKSELFDKHVGPFYNVKGVFDDRLRVARAWHAKGLTLFRVGDPDADY